jgi:ribokinase
MSEPAHSVRAAVIGSVNLDDVASLATIPRTGETVLSSGLEERAGGKGANQAVAMARLGAHVSFVGAVGKDSAGTLLRTALVHEGIDIGHLATLDTPTGRAFVMVDEAGHNAIVVAPGANGALTVETTTFDALGPVECAVLQLEVPSPTVEAAIRAVRRSARWVVLNAAPAHQVSSEALSAVDVLIVNEIEAAELSGQGDPVLAGRQLLERVRRIVVVTLGAQGAVLATREGTWSIRGLPVDAVDTTGAGDCFVGAFSVALAEGRSPTAAMSFANVASALSVRHKGAQASLPSRADVLAELAQLGERAHCTVIETVTAIETAGERS